MPTISKRRGTTARLDPDMIIEAGLRIAREPGSRSVTVRELGTELGADPTAIYRHFRSKDSLMQALLDRLATIARERVSAEVTDWKNFLRQSAAHLFDVYVEYPSIASEATRLSSGGAEELNKIEEILEAFQHSGLSGDELVRLYGVFSGFTVSVSAGFASASSTVGPNLEPFDASLWVDRSLDVKPSDHPLVYQTRDGLRDLTVRRLYEDGVELIISSAAAAARSSEDDRR